jgi:hypothetical protein
VCAPTWADTQVRPYEVWFDKGHDSMEMVGHNNEFIDLNTGKFVVYFRPPSCYHFTGIITNHFLAENSP